MVTRPNFAILSMKVISRFSLLELFQLKVYVKYLGGPTENAAKIFLAMQTRGEKQRALDVIAENFTPEKLKLFNEIKSEIKIIGKSRDKLAHWVWGVITDKKDCVLLADPRTQIAPYATSESSNIFVFFESDFLNMLSHLDSLVSKTLEFEMMN